MEALVVRALRASCVSCLLFVCLGASHRTQNFIVTASSPALAREIGEAAEHYRSQLAVDWLGKELPPWREPCPVQADVDPKLGAGGATSFVFETATQQYGRPTHSGDGLFQAAPSGRPFGWEMSLQGSRERVLDSVLPHEVTHTIFATHFGRPLPRWADEGACTTVEHESEKNKQHRLLYEFLTTNRGIPFNRMFAMSEYPADILPLYSQGFSLARFLIAQGGRRKFVQYVGDGLNSNDWTSTTRRFYGFESISELQITWLDWVRQGSQESPAGETLAAAPTGRTEAAPRQAPVAVPTQPLPAASWYASRGQQAASPTKPEHSTQTLAVAAPSDSVRQVAPASRATQPLRVSSRPQSGAPEREVLIEWGNPSPFLAPQLADKSAANTRR